MPIPEELERRILCCVKALNFLFQWSDLVLVVSGSDVGLLAASLVAGLFFNAILLFLYVKALLRGTLANSPLLASTTPVMLQVAFMYRVTFLFSLPALVVGVVQAFAAMTLICVLLMLSSAEVRRGIRFPYRWVGIQIYGRHRREQMLAANQPTAPARSITRSSPSLVSSAFDSSAMTSPIPDMLFQDPSGVIEY